MVPKIKNRRNGRVASTINTYSPNLFPQCKHAENYRPDKIIIEPLYPSMGIMGIFNSIKNDIFRWFFFKKKKKGCVNLKVTWHYLGLRSSIFPLRDSFCRFSEKGQRRRCPLVPCNKWGDIWTGAIREFLRERRHLKRGNSRRMAKGPQFWINTFTIPILFSSLHYWMPNTCKDMNGLLRGKRKEKLYN